MKTISKLNKFGALALMAASAIAPAFLSAPAGATTHSIGTVSISTSSTQAGKATTNFNDVNGHLYGTVYDTKSDGRCVEVWDRGYRAGVWGNYKKVGQACGVGTSSGYSDYILFYNQKVDVKLCLSNGGPCTTPKRVYG